MKKISLLVAIVLVLMFSGCTDKENAEKVLKQQGYTNIRITGYSILSCGKDDFQSTGFIASINGNTVRGTVCSGLLFKNSTIRFK